jgi:hypothetical protein
MNFSHLLFLGKISSYVHYVPQAMPFTLPKSMSAPILYSDYSLHTDWAREFFETTSPSSCMVQKNGRKADAIGDHCIRTLVYTDDRYLV